MIFRCQIQGFYVLLVIAFVCIEIAHTQTPAGFSDWKDPANAATIPDWTRRFLLREIRDLSGDARTQRLEECLAELKTLTLDSGIVPSTRYNAVLAIGQLVSIEPAPGNLPAAFPPALPCLIEFYQTPETPPYIKYGALIGIVRHALCGIDSEKTKDVLSLLLQTTVSEYPCNDIQPETGAAAPMEPEIWDWYRLTALDGIAALQTTDINAINILLDILTKQAEYLEAIPQNQDRIKRHVEIASKVAKTLGDLNYQNITDINSKKMIDVFARFSKALSDAELQIIAEIPAANAGSPDAERKTKQMVIELKMGTQSIAWGIRSNFLSGKPADHSFYTASVNKESGGESNAESIVKRLDAFWAAITEFASFLDEGNKTKRQADSSTAKTEATPTAEVSKKTFKFDPTELQEALTIFSASIEKIRNGSNNGL